MNPLSRHSFAFAVLLILLSLVPGIATACTCVKEQDPAAILRSTDVILDGYVEKVEPTDKEGRFVATIRVLRGWKGDLPDIVTLEYDRFDGCTGYGMLNPQTALQLYAFGDARRGPLRVGFCEVAYDKPSPELEAVVADYAAHYQALRKAADEGSTRDKIKLAEFLLSYGDEPQARDLLLPILQNEPELFRRWIAEQGGYEALVWVRHRSRNRGPTPPTASPSASGKEARAIFTLTGVANPEWKDWSNLELIGGECRFENLELTAMSFAESFLPACSFRKSMLSNVDFTNAVLREARFDGATLSNVTLDGAQLQEARFDGATLEAGGMRDAKAYGVSFKKTRLRDVELSGSFVGDFSGATLEKIRANISGRLDLTAAILRDVDFGGSDMALVAKNAHLEKVRFGIGRVQSLWAEDTDLSDVNFRYTRELVIYVNCRTVLPADEIDSRRLIPVERTCPGIQPRTDFRAVKWTYKDLRGLDFSGGDFSGASLRGSKLTGTNFSNSNLSRADFGGTSLSGVDLDGADLEGATNLGLLAEKKKGINGSEDVPAASLRGATFSGATVSISDLVGIAGLTASVDLDAPNFDHVTIRCLERPSLHHLARALRNEAIAAAQEKLEAQAIQMIRTKWPTAKFTEQCGAAH